MLRRHPPPPEAAWPRPPSPGALSGCPGTSSVLQGGARRHTAPARPDQDGVHCDGRGAALRLRTPASRGRRALAPCASVASRAGQPAPIVRPCVCPPHACLPACPAPSSGRTRDGSFLTGCQVIVVLNYLRHRRAHSGPEGPRASGRVTASRSTVSGLGHPTPPPALESRGSPRGPAALGGRRAQTRTCSPAVSLLPPLPCFFPHTEPRKRAVHTPAMRTGTRTPARPDTRVQTGARRHTLPRWELQATPAPPCPGLPARLSPASGRPSSRENRALHTNAPVYARPQPVYARPQPRPTDPLTGVRSCVLSLLPASSRLRAWATWAAAAPRRHQLRPHRPLEWRCLETVLLTSA